MSKVMVMDHPLIQHKIGIMRDKNTSTKEFRALVAEVAQLVYYEASRNLELADKVIFTGMIDEYFDYCYGELEYRSLKFETEELDVENYQGNAYVLLF